MITIRKSKVTLTLNKPTYVGMYILDLNKVVMYKFHHDYIRHKYDISSGLLFTDTGIVTYEIKIADICEHFRKDKEMFDLSNYPAESKYVDDSSKLVVGKMKDETGGITFTEIVRLKPKRHLFLVDDSSEHKKAKEVKLLQQ